MKFISGLTLVLLLGLLSCNKTVTTTTDEGTHPFISPAFDYLDVPKKEYLVTAEKGDTIVHNSGSILLFPANSFVDKAGKVVQGAVRVMYREISNPYDMFLSGIPLRYDSAGVSYTFESAGMCEVLAFKDNEPVFVNPNAKPKIYLASNDDNPAHNLYVMDTVQRNWVYLGKDIIKDVPATEGILPPAKPKQIKNRNQTFSIEIQPGSVSELQDYNNLQFEVEDGEKYNPEDTLLEWDDVRIERTDDKQGVFKVTFIRKDKTITVKAHPVFEVDDLTQAMKVYDKEYKKYQDSLKKSIAAQKKEARKKQKIIIDPIVAESRLRYGETNRAKVLRFFELNAFGIYNCDRPIKRGPDEIQIMAKFVSEDGTEITLKGVSLVRKKINSIETYPADPDGKVQLHVLPDDDMMLLSVTDDGNLAYLTFNDFKQYSLTPNATVTFSMRVHEGKITSLSEILGQ